MLNFIRDFIDRKSYPPSVRDIQDACKISSTSVVDYNLRLMEREGYIRRDREVSRGIELTDVPKARSVRVPVLGAIAAGAPIPVPTAGSLSEPAEESVPVPEAMLKGRHDVYALRVKGTSMIDALVNDGDIVLVSAQKSAHAGDIVVAWLKKEEETTLKKYFPEDGKVRLQPANPTMKPIYTEKKNLEIQGKVVGVLRDVVAE